MRHIFPILLLCTPGYAASQSPVIGPAQFFEFGLTYLRDDYDPPPSFLDDLVAASGPDYAIDLTPVSTMSIERTDEVIRGSALDQYAFFPDYYDTANVRISVYQGQQGFGTYLFLEDAEGIRYVGGQPNGVTWNMESCWMRYTNNDFPLELQEDMAFGFQYGHTIAGEWLDASGSDDHYVSGTSTLEADGYGSITMPDGTLIPNTLRLRNNIAFTDSNLTFGVNDLHDTIYTWYAEGITGPLMTVHRAGYPMNYGYISHAPLAVYRHPIDQAIGPRPVVPPPSVFPNPFTEEAVLTWPVGGGDGSVTITDAQGRVVWRDRLRSGRLQLQGKGFPPGLYAYMIGGGGDPWTAHGTFLVH